MANEIKRYASCPLHRENNRDKDSSQIARKSPIVTAGWIRRVSAPVPSEVAIDPWRIHTHIWIPADSQPWIGWFNNDNIFHLILLSCLHTWFSFAKIYLLWYKIQNNIFFHKRDTHSHSLQLAWAAEGMIELHRAREVEVKAKEPRV